LQDFLNAVRERYNQAMALENPAEQSRALARLYTDLGQTAWSLGYGAAAVRRNLNQSAFWGQAPSEAFLNFMASQPLSGSRRAQLGAVGDLSQFGTTARQQVRQTVNETATPHATSGQAFNVDSLADLMSLYAKISANTSVVSAKGYDGVMRMHPDGTRVGLRNSSTTGERFGGHGETIDVIPASGKPYKIHVKPPENGK